MFVVDGLNVACNRITQDVIQLKSSEKFSLLKEIILKRDEPTLVFIQTKKAVDEIYQYLKGQGVSVEQISGDLPQVKREQVLNFFRDGTKIKVLVATNVASRGLRKYFICYYVFN